MEKLTGATLCWDLLALERSVELILRPSGSQAWVLGKGRKRPTSHVKTEHPTVCTTNKRQPEQQRRPGARLELEPRQDRERFAKQKCREGFWKYFAGTNNRGSESGRDEARMIRGSWWWHKGEGLGVDTKSPASQVKTKCPGSNEEEDQVNSWIWASGALKRGQC